MIEAPEGIPLHRKACFWPWSHKWEKWKETDRGPVLREDGKVVAQYMQQERKCEICALLEARTIRT